MMLKTPFTAFILIFALASSVIILISLSQFATIMSDIIHNYTVLAFKATNPGPSKLENNTNQNYTTVNHPPVVNAGINQTVNETDTVVLNGIAIDSDPNVKLTYSWKQLSGPTVRLHDSNTTNPSFTAPTVASDRDLKFLLTAKDDKGAASNNSAVVIITVKHINHAPVANSGQEIQVANPGDTVTLDGSKSKDPDGSIASYSWIQIAGPRVLLDGANSPIATFTAPYNISADTTLAFKLTVKDDKNATGISEPKVTDKYIPPPNRQPIANAGSDRSVNAGDSIRLDGTKSKDPDGTVKSYSWKQIGGHTVVINGSDKRVATFTAPSNISTSTVLVFQITVKDDKNATGISVVRIIVNPVNRPPVANAGTNQTVNPGYVATLDGSKSKDPDNGDSLNYLWKQLEGPTVIINGTDSPIATFTVPSDISSDTTLVFELTIKDSKNATSTDDVTVTEKYIPPPNQLPTANAGTDKTVNASNKVTLDGSGSKDQDGRIASYSWMQTSGPVVILNGSDTSTPSFTAPSVSSDTTLKFTLTVKDDKGATSNNSTVVTIMVKAAPAVTPPLIAAPNTSENLPIETSKQRTISGGANKYEFIRKWGSHGPENGQFESPDGIAVDSAGNVYIADGNANFPATTHMGIQKFDSDGRFITKWGSKGSGDGEFWVLGGVAVNSAGNVYVTDPGNKRIQKFDSNSKFITKWGSNGTGDGQFSVPNGIAVDPSGNVYVTDYNNNRVQKFDSNGKFITKWGSKGSGDGQFLNPRGVAVDSVGNVYIGDWGNSRVQKFDSNGSYITKWSIDGPMGIAVDSSDNVYVSNLNYIQKFTSDGSFVTRWGNSNDINDIGKGDGELNQPIHIAVDNRGNVYVVDYGNSRVQVFAPSTK